MNSIIFIFFLAISLSMDAFSVSIFLGTINTDKKNFILISSIGIFHFIMPILGYITACKLKNILELNGKYIFGIILIIISLQVLISLKNTDEKKEIITNYDLILIALGVSIDSFSIGLGMTLKNEFSLFYACIFSVMSMLFTYLGILIGKYFNDKLGNYGKIIGAVLLLIFGIISLF